MDHEAGTVRLPPGVRLDPGGLGKGLAADLVVAGLLERGAAGALVSVGGDMRVEGRPPGVAGAWSIAIREPELSGEPLTTLALTGGGVATSTPMRRRWARPDGSTAHHLIDTRTGRPHADPPRLVSVLASTAVAAEVVAKARMAPPSGDGRSGTPHEALVVDRAGVARRSSGWAAYERKPEVAHAG